jgi:hypothetical protein
MVKGGGAGVYFFQEFIKKCTALKFDVLKIVPPPKKKSCEKNVPPPQTIFPLAPGRVHSFTFLKHALY